MKTESNFTSDRNSLSQHLLAPNTLRTSLDEQHFDILDALAIHRDDIANPKKVLLSGMLLNHCVHYSGLQLKKKNATLTPEEGARAECACIVHVFNTSKATRRILYSDDINSFLNSGDAELREESSTVIWFHLADTRFLDGIVSKYLLPQKVYAFFNDKVMRASFTQRSDNDMFLSIVSFCLQDGYVCAKKCTSYCRRDIVITFEQRIHAPEEDVQIRQMNLKANDSEQSRLTNILKSVPSTANVTRDMSTLNSLDVNVSRPNDLALGGINGLTVLALIEKLAQADSLQSILKTGGIHIVYEMAHVMHDMALPVLNFFAKEQLKLHDRVYVRLSKPQHTEGNELMDQIDTFQASMNIFKSILRQSDECIHRMLEKKAALIPYYYLEELNDEYDLLLKTVMDMDNELTRIDNHLKDLIKIRNDKVSLTFSVVATIFLPLNFIVGMFGMNFNNGGFLVHAFDEHNGTDYFYVLAAIAFFTVIVSLYLQVSFICFFCLNNELPYFNDKILLIFMYYNIIFYKRGFLRCSSTRTETSMLWFFGINQSSAIGDKNSFYASVAIMSQV